MGFPTSGTLHAKLKTHKSKSQERKEAKKTFGEAKERKTIKSETWWPQLQRKRTKDDGNASMS